ncbi:MAG: MliC family protein [Thiotrichales bacterium]|nr:MAG: MliC family protein [Thiotrichales bacterium]
MKPLAFFLMCPLALSGCTSRQPDGENPPAASAADTTVQTFVFECTQDFSFVARTETNRIWLFLPGNTIALPRVRSASGEKYSADGHTFWNKGDEAMIETGTAEYTGCKNNRARAIWEHAKLNGVDFRAVGNEPGWYMEISNRKAILLVTDYGQQTRQFTAKSIQSSPATRTTIYHAVNDETRIEVVLEGSPCSDTMSGEAFPTTVSVSVEGDRHYSGCGKPLH